MREKFPAFAAAWDDTIARTGQDLIAIAYQCAVEGEHSDEVEPAYQHEGQAVGTWFESE